MSKNWRGDQLTQDLRVPKIAIKEYFLALVKVILACIWNPTGHNLRKICLSPKSVKSVVWFALPLYIRLLINYLVHWTKTTQVVLRSLDSLKLIHDGAVHIKLKVAGVLIAYGPSILTWDALDIVLIIHIALNEFPQHFWTTFV